jgi:acetolactate synthase-1/2/3 large subunit
MHREEKKEYYKKWLEKCVGWKKKYPVCLPEYQDTKGVINIYSFVDRLSELSAPGDVFIADAGSAFYAVSQGIQLTKDKQRYIPSGAMATMGYTLPAAIGVSVATGDKRVLAVTGDGSLQQNIQELQTVIHNKIPLKIFLLNNNGYLAISLMQDNLFKGKHIGSTPDSGVSNPNFTELAKAYGFKTYTLNNNTELENNIDEILNTDGPVLCEIIMVQNQLLIPRVQSSKDENGKIISNSLENMFPYLSDDEMKKIML